MFMKKRYIDLLEDILKSREKVTNSFLKNKYEVSERTIRNDLKEIDHYLCSRNLQPITRSKTKGLYLDLPPIVIDQIWKEISDIDDSTYILNQEERMHYILFILLQKDEPVSINQIAEQMGFSRNTLVEDVKRLEKFLHEKSCNLIKKRKIGMYIETTEFQRRQLYIDLFVKHFNIGKWELSTGEVKGLDQQFHMVLKNEWKKLFEDIDLKELYSMILNIQDQLKKKYTDGSINTLILVVALSKIRYKSGHFVRLQTFHLETIKLSQEYKVLQSYLDDEHEIAYIAMYMLSNKILEQDNFFEGQLEDMEEITQKMIDILEKDLQISLQKHERQKLLKGLRLHMEPAVYRMRYNIGITNKLLPDIKKKYKKYYDAASKACMYISQRLHIIVPDEEIGFVALHFGVVVESHKDKQNTRVLLVCNAGMATVRIMEARIKEEFQNIEIIDYLSYSEYLKENYIEIDLIVSTVNVVNRKIPVVVVNPLLSIEDVERLKSYMTQKVTNKGAEPKVSVKKIMEICEKYCTIHSKKFLEQELKAVIGTEGESMELKLSQLISEDQVILNADVDSWEEAVKLGSQPLINSGHINKSYEKAMIDNIRKLKAYVVIRPGVAMPHAKPADGVNELGVSIVTLNKGVKFGHPKNDSVRLILVLANKDATSHLKVLDTFIRIIKNESYVEEILRITDYRDLKLWIENFEGEMK